MGGAFNNKEKMWREMEQARSGRAEVVVIDSKWEGWFLLRHSSFNQVKVSHHSLVPEFLFRIQLSLFRTTVNKFLEVEGKTIRLSMWVENKDQKKGLKCFT